MHVKLPWPSHAPAQSVRKDTRPAASIVVLPAVRANASPESSDKHASNRRDGSRGQAMIEFALVAILFFSLIIAIIEAGMWSLESMAASTAVENQARISASAANTGYSTSPTLVVNPKVLATMQSGMLGTPVVVSNGSCPADPDAVYAVYHKATVVLCAYDAGNGYVGVMAVGYANDFTSAGFGFHFTHGIPIQEQAVVHSLVFRP